ncbi:hypothetical protein VFPFJ_01365 [Purpureocillium lilacinum]|uniref:Uncharacterized protein n=1 Tax=Purpureocillium lilacinum TaxID=33203 RepID=A0A179HXK1_PURLI|nr:hypothetical protein VFPFJ_01365 [Purpureocillium lilacinum]OAQ87305.1 hypothetical protein VFPBJ_01345 [Purpureocillium lilacinum]OAQ95256.1 hypothetical protein VFPFJ_01365 [Purpureocillium lilacinum]
MFQLRIVQNVHSVGTGKIGRAALLALSDAIVVSLRMAYGRGRMLQYKTRNPVRAAAVDASESVRFAFAPSRSSLLMPHQSLHRCGVAVASMKLWSFGRSYR